MLHRIRESLNDKNSPLLNNVVEVDEVYIGGKVKNMSKYKKGCNENRKWRYRKQ